MAKDPAVLFFTSDFLSGTSFFNMEQRGQYITLLCEQHQLHSIPEDHLIKICGNLNSPVAKKFIKDSDGTYYQHRMREESEKRKSFCESRRKNIGERYKNYTRITHVAHTKVRMENGNGNRIEDENRTENIIEKRSEIFKEELKRNLEYSPQMLSNFWEYWSEPNKSKTKMRYELQPTWDLERRLKTWANREGMNKGKPKYGYQPSTKEETLAQMERIHLT